jgi:hypothetical protein
MCICIQSRRAQPCHATKIPPSAASSTRCLSSCCSSCGGARSSCRFYRTPPYTLIYHVLTHPYISQARSSPLLFPLTHRPTVLQVLLQHPRTHEDFVEFALTELRGALRIDAYNQAFSILQRVRAAIATVPTVSADTDKDIRQFLNEEARHYTYNYATSTLL